MQNLHNLRFMFREAELTRILNALEQGKSILLTGIRRTGKSSIVTVIAAEYNKQRF